MPDKKPPPLIEDAYRIRGKAPPLPTRMNPQTKAPEIAWQHAEKMIENEARLVAFALLLTRGVEIADRYDALAVADKVTRQWHGVDE